MNGEVFKHDPEEQWEDPYPTKKRSFRWFSIVLLLLTFYVLSVGPACRMAKNKIVSWNSVTTLYTPLDALAHGCEPVNTFLDWYVQIWVPKIKANHP